MGLLSARAWPPLRNGGQVGPLTHRYSSMIHRPHLLLLTGFGLGYLRPAPGTFGSMPPVLLALALAWLATNLQSEISNPTFLEVFLLIDLPLIVFALAFTIACIRFGSEAESHFARKDPSHVVADELAGQSIVLLFLPWRDFAHVGGWKWNLMMAASAFIAFRLMDILKPPPCRGLQRIPGGVGIVIDDLIAAVYALILTQIAVRVILPPLAA